MEQFVALDVSLKEISVCIIDGNGDIVFEGKTAAEPATLVQLIRAFGPLCPIHAREQHQRLCNGPCARIDHRPHA
jgi:hypothetical protein